MIATASGPVYAKTLGEMKDSLDFWGVAKTWKLGVAVMQTDWKNVDAKALRVAAKIVRRQAATERAGKAKPSFRVWKWFHISRLMQKYARLNPPDVQYWNAKGWTGKTRPWK